MGKTYCVRTTLQGTEDMGEPAYSQAATRESMMCQTTLRIISSESLRQESGTSSTREGKGEVAHRVTIDREGDFILTLSARGSGAAADPPKMEMPRGVRRRHGIKRDSGEDQRG